MTAQQILMARLQLKPLVARLRQKCVRHLLDQTDHVHLVRLQTGSADLAAGDLQKAVQHREQHLAACPDAFKPDALLLLQFAVEQQRADAHDGVHRRAHIVAERGKHPVAILGDRCGLILGRLAGQVLLPPPLRPDGVRP